MNRSTSQDLENAFYGQADTDIKVEVKSRDESRLLVIELLETVSKLTIRVE